MASTSETGHAKNVANFESLISFCTGDGPAYNPTNANIKIPSMTALLTSSRSALQTVKTTKTTFDNASNSREIGFDPFKKLSTRIINALEATNAAKQTIDDAKTINRKIQGKRAGGKSDPPAPPVIPDPAPSPEDNQISVSQQSFDSLIDNFSKLIVSVTAEPLYAPNENDLKISALNTSLTNLKALNTAVINAATPYSNARIARNIILYQPGTGLVEVAGEAKKYVKSVFGATSPQYKQISALQFKKVK